MSDDHSPLPWHYENYAVYDDCEGGPGAKIGTIYDMHIEDIRYMINTCNLHYELVKAVQWADEHMTPSDRNLGTALTWTQMTEDLLAKAKVNDVKA